MSNYEQKEDIKNYEVREDFNYALSIGLSANYICLRILDQESKLEKPKNNVYTREDIFNKSPREDWISHKMQAITNLRNRNINALTTEMSENDPHYLSLVKTLNLSKEYFISNYNIFTGRNLKFEEVVDGYNILDKEFDKFAKMRLLTPCLTTGDPDAEKLLTSYLNYLDLYEKYTIVKSYIDISQAIADAINENGRTTIYCDHPRNPLIKKLSGDEIADYVKLTAALYDDQETVLKAYHNALTNAYKVGAKKSTDMYHAAQRVNELTAKVATIGTATSLASEAFRLATDFEKRLEYANTDLTTTYSRVTEKLIDIFHGVSTFGEEKFKIDNVYVHQYELDFINFVFKLLETSPSQIKADHNDKEFSKAITRSKQRIAKENRENAGNANDENENEEQRGNE